MENEENGSPRPQQTKYCSNCKRDINAGTFDLHESHCKRHITLCEICEEPIAIREKDEHFQENHAPVACGMCGQRVPKHTLDDHEDRCPERRIECKYCELDMKAKEYGEHVEMCGSRTEICEMCDQRVMLKDLDEHKMVKCASVRAESPLDPNTIENLDYPQQDYYGGGFEYDPYGDQYGYHGDEYGYYGNNYGRVGGEYGHYGDGHNHYCDVHGYEQGQNGGESHTYTTEHQAPPPPYPGDNSIAVDPQWLETVAEACGEEDLDRVLAQNMFYANMRQVTARDEYQPIEKEVMEEGVAADRQRERDQQQVHRDEDIARQLQRQFDNKRLEEERDAEMARQLQQKMGQPHNTTHDNNTQPLISNVERDAQLAERLQEEEQLWESRLPATSLPPHVTESDAEMARRLQMEEDRNSAMNYKQEGVAPSEKFTYGSSHSHAPGSKNYKQEGYAPSGTFPNGSSNTYTPGTTTYDLNNKLPVQYTNDTTAGGGYGYEEPHPSPYGAHSNPYSPLYGDDEQPRAKTPPPTRPQRPKNLRGSKSEDLPYSGEEEKIPCQFCQKLIPFAQVMYHQKQCTADYYATTTSTGHTEQYNVDALLRENSPDEETSPANTIPCEFCGEKYTVNLLVPHQAPPQHFVAYCSFAVEYATKNLGRSHMRSWGGAIRKAGEEPYEKLGRNLGARALCECNPDKHLKDVYHPERTPRPHPQPHPLKGPVRETVHSLQRPPLHAEEQDPEIPCEFCGEGFPSSQINTHQPICTKNRDFKSHAQQRNLSTFTEFGAPTASGSMASPEEVEMGPCEFCRQPLPITELIKHEVTCQLQRSASHVPAIESESSFQPPLEPTTSAYKPSFDPITSTYIHRSSLQPMTSTHRPSLEPIAGSYTPSLEPTTSIYQPPSLQTTTSCYTPSVEPMTSIYQPPSLQTTTSCYMPSVEPMTSAYRPSLQPTASSSSLLTAQPVKPPRPSKNGPQIAIRFPQPSNTTGFSVSPGAQKPVISPETLSTSTYQAKMTTVPKLQSINTTPPTIAASVGMGSGYRPSAAAVHTTPAHTTSLSSTSIYKAPSAYGAVDSANSGQKRHISSTSSSPDLGNKRPRLVQAEIGHYNSSFSSKPAADISAYGGHTLASKFGEDPTRVSSVTQLKYSTTALRPVAHTPAAHTPARSIPLSSQGQELGSAYVYQHPTASTNPFPPSQVITKSHSTTDYNYLTALTPETSSMENRFLPSASQGTISPSITAALPNLPFAAISSLQQHSPLSSSPTSTGSTPIDDTPNLTPSFGSSQLPGDSLLNRGGGPSYKASQYTKDALKGGKGKGKGKHCSDVLSSMSITPNPQRQSHQSPDSSQSNGPLGDSSRSTTAQTSSFTPPLGYYQENVHSSTVGSSQLGTQRVERETLSQNPSQLATDVYTTTANPPPLKNKHLPNSSATGGREARTRAPQHKTRNKTGSSSLYSGVNSTVTSPRNSVRGKETGLEPDFANLKLSSTGDPPSNRSVKPALRSSQNSAGGPLQVPASSSSTRKPKKREEQLPNSASWQRTGQKSGKSVTSSGARQLSTQTQRSTSQHKPMTRQPPHTGSTHKQESSIRSTTASKGSSLPAESASRSPKNPQLQHKTSRGGPKSGSRKPNATSTTTTHCSPGGVQGRPQTGRNTSSRGATNMSTARKT